MAAADEKQAGDAVASTQAVGPHGTPANARPSMRPGGPQSLIGLVLSGRYKIEKLLGEGGMGAVYQAEHQLMRKRMAIKVLHPEMSRLPEVRARFEREAQAAAHIDHPNVATATDFGKLDDGSFFLALEFVEGKSLREVVAEGPLELGRALHVVDQIASALSRAHSLGIVHRDLKPENVMLVERDGDPDFVKVLDFGIAKVPVGGIAKAASNEPAAPVLTQAGMVYGTPEYMAPEQALGQEVDLRADLYAVGVMAYEMISGTRPFEADSKVALLGMQVTAPVPSFAERCPEANVPVEVEAIVTRLLAKEASERTCDAKELIDAIHLVVGSLAAQGRIDPQYGMSLAIPTSQHVRIVGPATANKLAGAGAAAAGAHDTPPETVAPPKPAPSRGVLLAVGGAIVFFLAVIAVAFALRGHAREGHDEKGPASASASSVEAPPPPNAQIKKGIEAVESGNYRSGIEQLSALEQANNDRADLHHALLTAYASTDKPRDAMREAGLWLKADAKASEDQKLRIAVRDVAIGRDASAADEAFALLEQSMGTIGMDDLFDIAYGASGAQYPVAATRAQKEIKRPDLRANMTPGLQVTVDVRTAGATCQVKTHFERAQKDGDARTLAALSPLLARRPSGFLGRHDALACIHADGSLAKTMAAIEERQKQK